MGSTERHEKILLHSNKAVRRKSLPPAGKERGTTEVETAILENILVGVQRLTQTAFYISCGAAMFAWEAFEKVFQTLYESRSRALFSAKKAEKMPKRSGRPQKIKVPILPIDDYDRLDIDQVKERLAGLSKEKLSFLREYEKANQNREEILREINRELTGNP
ncbi:MAG: hypothetical protein WAO55_03475 [Candidatus Manganitrophaceae bacterium]